MFAHEEEARDQQMSAEARLAYHQEESGPRRDELQSGLDTQFEARLVEPKSSLGPAMASMPHHWTTLRRFLQLAGAPLDHNVVARALQLFIRQRPNALCSPREHSASIASVLTRLIAPCLYAGGNVLDYFVALHKHRAEVLAAPAAWLPWT